MEFMQRRCWKSASRSHLILVSPLSEENEMDDPCTAY